MGESPESLSNEQILQQLRALENRITRIEARLELPQTSPEEIAEPEPVQSIAAEDDEELELRVGQNWFANAGIVGLALGIAFLLTLPYDGLPSFLPSLFGYALVGGIFFLSHYWKESFQQISRYLLGGGLLLLYFATLRLSHFTTAPAITSPGIELTLLLAVVVYNLSVAFKRQSIYLTASHLALGYFTALIGGQTFFVLSVITLLSATAVYFTLKFRWNALLAIGITFTYLTHFIWTANNPFFGNTLQFGVSPQIHLAFILLYTIIFAGAEIFRSRDIPENFPVIFNTVLTALFGYGLFALSSFVAQDISIPAWQAAASVVFLVLSVVFWVREHSVYATFVYAILGYTALSAAIVAQFPQPDFFVWLCWQSIIVVSTAVWFRSRFIIVANFIIYLFVFIAYLSTAATVGSVSVSFGIVALLSARVLNWQRDRLELRTDLMRNAYLASALLFLPYALYNSVPPHFVSVSWLILASFYYMASRLLKSRKYRWMALLTTLLTILYVFVVDLTTVDPVVRIVSFLVVGSVLLTISMIYSRKKQRIPSKPRTNESTQ
ncbi:MAG: hypothetical protein Q8P51_04120 [Ignavibacteria bacterium]|nr:hypothetical protein [Ignavibacteria bacterium]